MAAFVKHDKGLLFSQATRCGAAAAAVQTQLIRLNGMQP